jgi:hypothetical protein
VRAEASVTTSHSPNVGEQALVGTRLLEDGIRVELDALVDRVTAYSVTRPVGPNVNSL